MPWPLIMLLQNSCAAIFAILSRPIAKNYKTAHFQFLAIVFAVLYMIGLVYVLGTSGKIDRGSLQVYGIRYMVGGSLFGIWSYFSYRVFEYVDAAISTLLSLLNIVAVVLVATVTINEGLDLLQILGALMLLVAIGVIHSSKASERARNQWHKAVIFSLLASSTYGLAIANEKWLLDRVHISTYIVYGFGFQLLPLLILSFVVNPSAYRYLNLADFRNKTILAGLVRGGAGLLFIISLVEANNVSLISVLAGFKVVLTTLLAAWLLREKQFLRRKLGASMIAMLGIAIMLWK